VLSLMDLNFICFVQCSMIEFFSARSLGVDNGVTPECYQMKITIMRSGIL
jgi:hypothetical protein